MAQASSPESKSAFASLTLQGAAAMVVAYVAARLGLHLDDAAIAALAQAAVDLAFSFGAMAVSLGRARATAPLR